MNRTPDYGSTSTFNIFACDNARVTVFFSPFSTNFHVCLLYCTILIFNAFCLFDSRRSSAHTPTLHTALPRAIHSLYTEIKQTRTLLPTMPHLFFFFFFVFLLFLRFGNRCRPYMSICMNCAMRVTSKCVSVLQCYIHIYKIRFVLLVCHFRFYSFLFRMA